MRSLVMFLPAVLLAAPTVLLPSRAVASPPSAAYSVIGHGIVLGGVSALGTDPLVAKRIDVRGAFNNPIQNATVVLDFSACANAGDIRLCANQPNAGVTVNCGAHTISAVTDVNGTVTFLIAGTALNPGGGTFGVPAPGYGAGGARVLADGVMLGTLTVAAFDQDGQLGVGASDIARFLNDDFSFDAGNPIATERGRSDYNADGKVDLQDLALLLRARFANGSSESCASACP